MKLKELNLVSFGKFEEERINFEDGLNIIYGENESGKTTIHNFIDGMFYGFLRPYVTRRYYRVEYEKYRPWGRELYKGILRFSKDDIEYMIERDFGRGQVKVYEDLTGKDITKDIDTGERVKVHLPGVHFFDFNTTVYNNTVSIKQLGNRIDSDLATEVKDRLANISTSLDDNISVKDAISQLEKQLETIGTEKAFTRPYGKAIKSLDKLKEERKEILQKQEEYNENIDQSNIMKEEITNKKLKIQELENALEKAEMFQTKRIYEEGVSIKKELKIIDKEIQKLEDYSQLSFDEYTMGLRMNNNRENLQREIVDLSARIDSIVYELKDIETKKNGGIVRGIKVEELYEDISHYNELDEEKNELIMGSQKTRLEILNSQLKDMMEKFNRSRIHRITLILLVIGSLGLGLINPFTILLALPFAGLAFYVGKTNKKHGEDIEKLKQEIEKNQLEEERKSDKIQKIEKYQNNIMTKYNCSSKLELHRLYDDVRLQFMKQRDMEEKTQRLKEEMGDIQASLKSKRKKEQELIENMNLLMEKNRSKTLDEFKEGLEKKRIYENLIRDRDSKIEVLNNLLSNVTLEELKDKISHYDEEYFKDARDIDKNMIMDQIKKEKELFSIMTNDFARLEERIDNLNQEVRELVVIEEEIQRFENLIQDFEDRIKSINIAKEAIEKISEEIHGQFAPAINKKVSQVIQQVTNGKYSQIRINDELNIAIENPITKEIIDIDNLSGGTIDQLYFALRFSIINSIEESNLPLILDDCFIQYDNERLKNVLKFLGEIGDRKQILLFTCHRREEEILKELGLKYNLINIA